MLRSGDSILYASYCAGNRTRAYLCRNIFPDNSLTITTPIPAVRVVQVPGAKGLHRAGLDSEQSRCYLDRMAPQFIYFMNWDTT